MVYREIVFLQNDNAYCPLKMIERGHHEKVFQYLLQWDYGEGEERSDIPWGTADKLINKGKYVISYNRHLDYVSLTEVIQ